VRRGALLAALAAALMLPGCPSSESPQQPTGGAPVSVTVETELSEFLGDLLFDPEGSVDDDADPDADFARAPPLPAHAAGLAAAWTEPVRVSNDGTDTWSWEGPGSAWELVVRGTPSLSEDDSALVWVAERDGFTLTVADERGESLFRATCMQDGRPLLDGMLRGAPAAPGLLQAELARVLPAVSAHLGLAADQRVESALQHGGVPAALGQIAALTSSAARLAGYSALARELDEPTHKQLAQLLRQAAGDLTSDGDMRELLIEELDLSLEARAVTDAVLAAAASIDDQDALAAVLADLLERTDDAPPNVLGRLLYFAAEHLTRDAPLATLLDEVAWHDLRTPQAQQAWRKALASLEADGPHAKAVESLLSIGDAPPAECALVVRSAAAHIETESLRRQALASIHLEQLVDGALADAYLAALESFEDVNELTDLLTDLLRRPDGSAALSALWLKAGRKLTPDGRLGSLLGAVPSGHLIDPDVKAAYRPLASSLWSVDARSTALRRVPVDPPR